MTDRYENIRKALAMGPTPGPWVPKELPRDMQRDGYRFSISRGGFGCWIAKVTQEANGGSGAANAALIAACDPDTSRALLAERDALATEVEALRAEVERLRADRDSREQQASDRVADWHAEHLRAERLEKALSAYQTAVNKIDDLIEYSLPMPPETKAALYAVLANLTAALRERLGEGE